MALASIAKKGAVLALIIAVSIGTIGKFKPHYFMVLPFPLSLILWSSAGGGVPPYFTEDAWAEDEITTWTNPGDLIVAPGAKSGTTWMLYCAHQIRLKGAPNADELFFDVSQATPWPDLVQSRAGSWAEQKDRWNTTVLSDGTKLKDRWDNPAYKFRIFKSHYGPIETGSVLPIRDNRQLKFLGMVRDGLDVLNSMVYFWSSHTDEFRHLWGGFPPDSTGDIKIDAETRLQEMLPGGILEHFYFKYVETWWPMRNEPNVLLLHYADARKDLKSVVEKIAKFVEVELTGDELATITERCDISHMKEHGHMFQYTLPLNTDDAWDNDNMHIIKADEMIRQGKLGGGKDLFNEEQIARWRKAEDEVLGSIDKEMLTWARHGGKYS